MVPELSNFTIWYYSQHMGFDSYVVQLGSGSIMTGNFAPSVSMQSIFVQCRSMHSGGTVLGPPLFSVVPNHGSPRFGL